MLPALVSEILALVRNSSLVSGIAVTDLTRWAQIASSTFNPLESHSIALVAYVATALVLSAICMWPERLSPEALRSDAMSPDFAGLALMFQGLALTAPLTLLGTLLALAVPLALCLRSGCLPLSAPVRPHVEPYLCFVSLPKP